MNPANSSKYIIRRPYHERVANAEVALVCKSTEENYDLTTTVFPDIPDDLIMPSDRLARAGDWERLHTDDPSDAMYGYPFDSQARRDILAAERAARRLGVTGQEQIESAALADLRTQQAIGGTAVQTSVESISPEAIPGYPNQLVD